MHTFIKHMTLLSKTALTRTLMFTLIFGLVLFINTNAIAEPLAEITGKPLPAYSKIYDDTRDPFKDAADALALAKESERQVLIEVGGNWCGWCKKMDSFLINNPEVYHALHSQYVVLKVNVSDSNENTNFMKSLPPVLGYPHMYVSTAQGKMILSKDTAELLNGDNYSKAHWLTFLDRWSTKTTLAQALLSKTPISK